jgi:hypothetical protein
VRAIDIVMKAEQIADLTGLAAPVPDEIQTGQRVDQCKQRAPVERPAGPIGVRFAIAEQRRQRILRLVAVVEDAVDPVKRAGDLPDINLPEAAAGFESLTDPLTSLGVVQVTFGDMIRKKEHESRHAAEQPEWFEQVEQDLGDFGHEG